MEQSRVERDEIARMSEELEELLEGLNTQEVVEAKPQGSPEVWKAMAGAGDGRQAVTKEKKAVRAMTGTEESAATRIERPEPEKREADGKGKNCEELNRESRSQEARRTEKLNRRQEQKKRRREDFSEGYFRPKDGLWAAFIVPVIIMIIIFAQRGIFPFGDKSFLRTDMYHQYAPFFSEFQHKLTEGGSLFYSWDIGMGVNFSALYAYYLASPLNWLLVLCPKGLVIEFMTYSIVLKIGLAGLSFAWYLRRHCGREDFGVAFFGIFYALSGYMAAYSWNIMWLDCILLFPVVMMGIERLVKEKRGLLYSVSLGICILSNYYISIMICMFMVIYFFALLILESGKGQSFRDYAVNCLQFGVYSLAAGGLAAAVLLPEIYALQMTASGDFNFPKTVTSYFSIFDMIARHIAIVDVEIGLDHWPNIYCGVAVLMFFLLYLACRRIGVKEKAVYCGLLLIFLASFSTNVLNFIWHGFHYPNSLPCRQSFIYIFLMLVMCYRAYSYLRVIPWKAVAMAFWGSVSFVILAEKLVEQEHFEFYVYYIAIVMLAIYAGLIYLYKKGRKSKGSLLLLALAVVSVEAAVNTTVTSVTVTSRSGYLKDNDEVRVLTEYLQPADTFYRVEKVTRKTKNDGAWMNFPSASLFSSTANADLTAFFKSLGCEASTNAYSITGSTPLVDSLFSLKYGLYFQEQPAIPNLMFLKQSGGTYLYMRHDTLPVGFVVAPDMEDNWQLDLGNPAAVQNDLCDVIGVDRVLKKVATETESNKMRFTPEVDGEYYVYIGNKKAEKVDVDWGEESKEFKNLNRGFFIELGWCPAGQEIVLTGDNKDEKLKAEVYLFEFDAMHQVYEKLNRYPFEVSGWSDTTLEGIVTTDKAGLLFTSIPYDKGWTVEVDGVKQETRKIFDTFLSVELTEGAHTIRCTYEPQGLALGIWISLGSALFLVLAAAAERLWTRKRDDEEWLDDQEYDDGLDEALLNDD